MYTVELSEKDLDILIKALGKLEEMAGIGSGIRPMMEMLFKDMGPSEEWKGALDEIDRRMGGDALSALRLRAKLAEIKMNPSEFQTPSSDHAAGDGH